MYKIEIIAIGKLKEPGYKQLEQEFLKRLSPFMKLTMIELSEVSYKTEDHKAKARFEEAGAVLGRLKSDDIVILLEETGQLRNSLQFADFIDRTSSLGRRLIFVIGSGIGLHDDLRSRANHIVSLSPLTLLHNMARVILLEQLYRATTILSGKKYHN